MRILDRHRARREQNLPTITCFVGSIEEAKSAFGDATSLEGDEVAKSYAASILRSRPVVRDALSLLARTIDRSQEALERELPAKTPRDRAVLFGAIDLQEDVRALIEAWCEDRAELPQLELGTLAGIVPHEEWPGILLAHPSERALLELASMVEEHPFIRAAVVVESDRIDRMPPRLAAMLREGLVRFPGLEQARRAVLEAKDPDEARSAAELFLYRVLQSMPDTRDLFALNVHPGFEFGGRPAEIDLASSSRRIAIEIDGYFHFQDVEAYRRDRRKDLLLQTHGYFILRFLAEDVVVRLEETLAAIRHALVLRPGGKET